MASTLTQKLNLPMMQTKWAQDIQPILQCPLVSGISLKKIALNNGTTSINHLLGRVPQGWYVTDITGSALIYRSQPFNNLTLTLTSNAAVIVNLWIF